MGRRALGPNMRFSVRLTDIKPPSSDVRGRSGGGEGFPSPPRPRAPRPSPAGCPRPGAALAVSPGAALGRCAGAVTSHQLQPLALTRLRSFAAEPLKESAIHSSGWAEPGVAGHRRARGPPRDGAGRGAGIWGFSPFRMWKGSESPSRCVGKFILRVTSPGGAEPAASQISQILLYRVHSRQT